MGTPSWMRPDDLETLRAEREKTRLASEARNSPAAVADRKQRVQEAQEAFGKKFEYSIRATRIARPMLDDTSQLMRSKGVKRLELGTIRDRDGLQTTRMTLTLYETGSLRIQRVNTVVTEPKYTAIWHAGPIVNYDRYPVGRKAEEPLFLLSCGHNYGLGRHNKDNFTYGGGLDDPIPFHCEDCGPGIPRVAPFSTGKYPEAEHDSLLANALTFACFKAGLVG